MTKRIIDVSDSLWLVLDVVPPGFDDGVFIIRDDAGNETLIDKEEIPALIAALQTLVIVEQPKGDTP